MIIPIPGSHMNAYEIPAELPPPTSINSQRDERIRWYLDVPSWKCVKCNTTMMGRCQYCAYCKVRLNVYTPKP